jgi:hypothetical protein
MAKISFSFFAYGILAIAALGMVLYTMTSMVGQASAGEPLLTIAVVIVVTFILYMFAKLVMSHRY